jgi:hypothetical protein
MRREYFGMRRANGDWFAMEIESQRRVLVFRSLDAAWRWRAKNPQLMLFWPVPVDDKALAHFARANDGRPVSFWLIDEDDPAADLRRGHPLEYMQLATLERFAHLPLRPKTRSVRNQTATEFRAWAV